MTKQADRFAEIMRLPFEEALAGITEPLAEGENSAILGMAHCQVSVRDALSEVDWDNTGLEDVDLGDGVGLLHPHDYANRLMAYAFDDAYSVVSLCQKAAEQQNMHQGFSIGATLLRSRRSLLKISLIDDQEKGHLMASINSVQQGVPVELFAGVPKAISAPIDLTHDTGSEQFSWTPDIEKWITERVSPESGCPAHKEFVEVGGSKISLVNFFWDRLVRAMYPVDTELSSS